MNKYKNYNRKMDYLHNNYCAKPILYIINTKMIGVFKKFYMADDDPSGHSLSGGSTTGTVYSDGQSYKATKIVHNGNEYSLGGQGVPQEEYDELQQHILQIQDIPICETGQSSRYISSNSTSAALIGCKKIGDYFVISGGFANTDRSVGVYPNCGIVYHPQKGFLYRTGELDQVGASYQYYDSGPGFGLDENNNLYIIAFINKSDGLYKCNKIIRYDTWDIANVNSYYSLNTSGAVDTDTAYGFKYKYKAVNSSNMHYFCCSVS